MATLFLSKEVNKQLNAEIEKKVSKLLSKGITPKIAFLRVGDNPDDIYYEESASKRCEKFGIETVHASFDIDVSFDELASFIDEVNDDDTIHGLLMLRPLPKHIDEDRLCNMLNPKKDTDGITNSQAAGVYKNSEGAFAPCTAKAVVEILKRYEVELTGKNVVVIGRSLVIGRPVSMMLMNENATVTICHSRTKGIEEICKRADILVVAIGRERYVNKNFVSEGQIVIDVGIHATKDGGMCGDVDFEEVEKIVSAITPVPGGVGGVTTSMLILSLLEAAECR